MLSSFVPAAIGVAVGTGAAGDAGIGGMAFGTHTVQSDLPLPDTSLAAQGRQVGVFALLARRGTAAIERIAIEIQGSESHASRRDTPLKPSLPTEVNPSSQSSNSTGPPITSSARQRPNASFCAKREAPWRVPCGGFAFA
jgi:hypothetical protein